MNTEKNEVAGTLNAAEFSGSAASWIEQHLKDLNNQFVDDVKKDDDAKKDAHKRIRQRVAKMWETLEKILKDKSLLDEFIAVAFKRDIPSPGVGENWFRLAVRMFDGRYDVGNISVQSKPTAPKWVWSKSSEKYAGVLRWLYQNPDEIRKHGGDIVKLIESYDGGEGIGKKINGIIAADQKANGSKPRIVIAAEGLDQLRALPALASIPMDAQAKAFTLSEEGYGLALVRKSGRGDTLEVIRDAALSKADITRALKACLAALEGTSEGIQAADDAVMQKAAKAADAVREQFARFGNNQSAA